jgi:hypothetical protein
MGKCNMANLDHCEECQGSLTCELDTQEIDDFMIKWFWETQQSLFSDIRMHGHNFTALLPHLSLVLVASLANSSALARTAGRKTWT